MENNVRVAHLIGGHVIIGMPGEETWTDVLTMQLAVDPQSGKQVLQYGAAAVFGESMEIDLNTDLIMFSYKPDNHISSTYKENLVNIRSAKSGIITPGGGGSKIIKA